LRNGHLELDGNGTVTVEKHSWASADGSICSSPGPNSYSYSEGDDWQSRGQGFETPQLHHISPLFAMTWRDESGCQKMMGCPESP